MHRQETHSLQESEYAPTDPSSFKRVMTDSQPSSSSCSTCSLEPLLTSIQYKTGISFEGYIAKTRRGRASFTWTSGLSYIGEFKEDKREGYGTLKWPDGSTYEGYFHNDIREGEGMHKWEDSGEVCNITWNDSFFYYHGYEFISSFFSSIFFLQFFLQVYDGKYHNDKRHGYGVYKWPSGATYVGKFKEDLRSGQGTYISPYGEKFEVINH